jgi:hypothetical protein
MYRRRNRSRSGDRSAGTGQPHAWSPDLSLSIGGIYGICGIDRFNLLARNRAPSTSQIATR